MSKIKKWSKEEVFKKLQHLSLTYDVISYNQYLSLIKRTEYPHIHIIKNYFGSIKKGFELVGIEYVEYTGKKLLIEMQKMNIKYKKQDIIGGLQLIYKKYGEIKPIDLPKYLKQENLFGKDIIGKHFGTIEAAYKAARIPYKSYYWTNKRLILILQKLYNENGRFLKTEINTKFRKKRFCPGAKLIRDRFGSLNKAAEYAGFTFKEHIHLLPNIGKNETKLLNEVEKKNGVILSRSYKVKKYFIDGYDIKNNIAYEVDEKHHQNRQIQDIIRENNIIKELNCSFIRIKDY